MIDERTVAMDYQLTGNGEEFSHGNLLGAAMPDAWSCGCDVRGSIGEF